MATLTTSYQKIGTGGVKTFNATKARIDLYAKYNSQSIPNNSSNYSIEARLVITSGSYIGEYDSTTLTLSGNSISSTQSKGTGEFRSKALGSASGTVTHNANGTKSVSCSASMKFKTWGTTLTVSGSADLPTIPRYATINSFTVSKRDETSFTFNWSTNATIDYLWYSTNNGSSWTGYDTADGTSGSFTVSGLSNYTTYNCKIRVRRKDSQLTTDSSAVSQTTYNYPFLNSSGNFTIGSTIPLNLYNPLGRSLAISILGADNSVICSGTRNVNGDTVLYTTAEEKIAQYNSIPNSKEGNYRVRIVCSAVSRDTTVNGSKYTIVESECLPTFENFDYEDVNANTLAMTSNNQLLVDNYSLCEFGISQPATAKNGASISRYNCYYGNVATTILEQDMATYWLKNFPERFTINYNSNTDMNEISCAGASGWECLYFQLATTTGKKYKLNFDYYNPNGYTPLSGYTGIRCQVLTSVTNSNNTSSEIDYVLLDPTANNQVQNLEIEFTATTGTTYICFNFGMAVDGATTILSLGNFTLSPISGSGNLLKVEAVDSRGLATPVTKTITNIPYINAFINEVGTERKDGVDSKTYLKGKFTIFKGNWKAGSVANDDNRLKYVGYSVYDSLNDSWSNYYDITNAVLTNATVTEDTATKTYEFDYDSEIQIHQNGSSGGFTIGTEYQIKVLIKDGDNQTVFVTTPYEAVSITDVSDGTVATCLHKDSNGIYHLGFNGLSDDTWLFSIGEVGIIKERV